jgi:hypothetical protein
MNTLRFLRCPNCRQSCIDDNNDANQKSINIGKKCKNDISSDWECCICMNCENDTDTTIIKLNNCVCKGNNQYVHKECIMSFFKVLTQNIGTITFDLYDEDELYEHILNEFINFQKSFQKLLKDYKKKAICDVLLEFTPMRKFTRHYVDCEPDYPGDEEEWYYDTSNDEYVCSCCKNKPIYTVMFSSELVYKMKGPRYCLEYYFGETEYKSITHKGVLKEIKYKSKDGELAYDKFVCDNIDCKWNFLKKFREKSLFKKHYEKLFGSLIDDI